MALFIQNKFYSLFKIVLLAFLQYLGTFQKCFLENEFNKFAEFWNNTSIRKPRKPIQFAEFR